MAKQELDNPLRRTDPEPEAIQAPASNADLDRGRIVSSGVGITEGELQALDSLAARYDTTRNSLMHMAIRDFIERVRSGELDPGARLEDPKEPPKRRYRRARR